MEIFVCMYAYPYTNSRGSIHTLDNNEGQMDEHWLRGGRTQAIPRATTRPQ